MSITSSSRRRIVEDSVRYNMNMANHQLEKNDVLFDTQHRVVLVKDVEAAVEALDAVLGSVEDAFGHNSRHGEVVRSLIEQLKG